MEEIVQFSHNHWFFLCYGDGISQDESHTPVSHSKKKKKIIAPQEKECILHSFPDERKLWFHTDLESFHLQMWQIYVYKRFSS